MIRVGNTGSSAAVLALIDVGAKIGTSSIGGHGITTSKEVGHMSRSVIIVVATTSH